MDAAINKEWSRVSTELVRSPENFDLWQQLILAAESNGNKGINKITPIEEVNVLRISYQKLLEKYPLLTNYWIKYAELEFKLGDTEKANEIYGSSLKHLGYSIELWTAYLTFKINTLNDNLNEILDLFETARTKIGYHFHAYEYYKLYLSFLDNYRDQALNDFQLKYYVLLRVVVEIPLYRYDYFFKLLFDSIALIPNTPLLIPFLIPAKELTKKQSDPKTVSIQLKKLFIDAYITTQFKTYELFNFEKNLLRDYFDHKYITNQQLETWNRYLDYLELSKLPQPYIMFAYERCLIATANYPNFWIRYANYFITIHSYTKAIESLMRGYSLNGNYKILLKLVDLHVHTKKFSKARDLIILFIKYNSSVPLPVYEKLLNLESLFHPEDHDHMIKVFRELIYETQNEWFLEHLLLYTIPLELKQTLFNEFEATFKDSIIFQDARAKLAVSSNNEKPNFQREYDEEMQSFL